MSIVLKTKHVVLLCFAVLLAIFALGWYLGHAKGDRSNSAVVASLNNKINSYSIMLDDAKKYVTEKEQIITTQKEAIKAGELTREEMRKLNMKNVQEITRLNMRIDTLLHIPSSSGVVYVDTCTNKPKPALLLPFTWSKTDQWLSLKDSCDIKGVNHVSLNMDVPIKLFGAVDKDTRK
jgi:hypothetical protein